MNKDIYDLQQTSGQKLFNLEARTMKPLTCWKSFLFFLDKNLENFQKTYSQKF